MQIDHLYDSTKNIHWYHLGGHSYQEPVYRQFYDWLQPYPMHYVYTDMPHDYWVFLNEADRLAMHAQFNEHIGSMEKAACCTHAMVDVTAPIDPVEQEIMDVLKQAIQEEVNTDIFGQLTLSSARHKPLSESYTFIADDDLSK